MGATTRKADPVKRARTRQRNVGGAIDKAAGIPVAEFDAPTPRSSWWDKFDDLADRVLAGELDLDTFYPIGWFDSPHGAQNVIRQYRDRIADDLSLTKKTVPLSDGTRGSVLFCAMLSVADEPVHEAAGVTWTEPTLPLEGL